MLAKIRNGYRSTLAQALAGAIVLWAALPPLDWWPLGWLAPAWWVMLARRKELAGRRPYAALYLAGFLFWMAAYHFLRLPHWATSFGWVALSAYLAFYLPVFVGLVRVGVHRLSVPLILAAPIVWTALELARAHLLTGITMASLGHTQYHWIKLIQISDLAGAYGVSFVVMLVAACLARMLPCDGTPPVVWPLLPGLVVVGAAWCYGHFRVADQQGSPTARVALVQGSIDSELKSDPAKRQYIHNHYRRLSNEATNRYKEELDLIVWPETMFRQTLLTYDENVRPPDQWLGSEAEFYEQLQRIAQQGQAELAQLAGEIGVPLILGVDRCHITSLGQQRFNSAVLVSPSGELLDCYDKIHLVLFGEYVPFAGSFPWLYRLTPLGGGLTAGREPAAFEVAGLRLAPNICYETVMPHVIRRQVNDLTRRGREPDVLVNLTNDGWFWGSSELDMHLICGVFRAVECRKPLLIAANTGFSAWIDADGRILRQGPRRDVEVLLAEVRADRRTSWYLYYGDWPAGICLAVSLVPAAVGCWKRRVGRA